VDQRVSLVCADLSDVVFDRCRFQGEEVSFVDARGVPVFRSLGDGRRYLGRVTDVSGVHPS
jgi:hypothetical protein